MGEGDPGAGGCDEGAVWFSVLSRTHPRRRGLLMMSE